MLAHSSRSMYRARVPLTPPPSTIRGRLRDTSLTLGPIFTAFCAPPTVSSLRSIHRAPHAAPPTVFAALPSASPRRGQLWARQSRFTRFMATCAPRTAPSPYSILLFPISPILSQLSQMARLRVILLAPPEERAASTDSYVPPTGPSPCSIPWAPHPLPPPP